MMVNVQPEDGIHNADIYREDKTMATELTAAPVTPMQMLQIAVEQGADLDKLTKLMDLQERWEANEARKAFVVALNEFKKNPPELVKDRRVSFPSKGGQTEYYHATLEQVSSVIGRALALNGLAHRWETEQPDGGMIRVRCILMHEKGHTESVSLSAGRDESGGKNNIQGVASTVTYLERYTLLAISGMATKDMDDDDGMKAEAAPLTDDMKTEIIGLVRETKSNERLFYAIFHGATNVEELSAADYPRAIAMLNRKKRQNEAAK